MAKANSQGTPTRGRIGGWSYFESIRGLIVRIATNIIPKGRKSTEAQRLVQLALANLVILWRSFDSLLTPTFKKRAKGETEPNAFTRENWNVARVYLTKDMVKAAACVVPPVKVNVGRLDPIKYWKDSVADWVATNILLGDLVITADTTVGEFSQAVITHNSVRFQNGDEFYLDFIRVYQSIDINTSYPAASTIGRHLMLDTESTAKLWETTGGCEGFESYNGHLASRYAERYMYAWIFIKKDSHGEYVGSTQALLGDNMAMLRRFTSLEAFEAACDSYGGFSQKFLIPYKAKLNPFNYTLNTNATVAGRNPDDGPLGNGSQEGEQAPAQVQLTFAVNDPALGQVSPASGLFTVGSTISATASLRSGVTNAEFSGWSYGVSTATRTIVVPATPQTYTANFRTTSSGGGTSSGDDDWSK